MSFFHSITREGRPFQRYTLYLLARWVELPFLRVMYKLLRGGWRCIGSLRVVRKAVSALLTRPVARFGDTAKPIPFDELVEHLSEMDGVIAVGPCRCRISHEPCGHPLDTDIVIRTGTAAWLKAFPHEYRIIEKDEALRIIEECHRQGMFHMLFFHCPATGCAEYVICNCCTCGCVPYIINRELGQENFPLFKGDWIAYTDSGKCTCRADCIEICPFDARKIVDGKLTTSGCYGCGLCVGACPEGAISMMPINNSSGDNQQW